jgi:iron-sulfur cluster assembly accessory protein
MINISEEAAEKIKEILKVENMSHAALRISAGASGCCGPQYEISIDDKTGDGDTVIEKSGAKVYLDADSTKALEGGELGFINDERGQGFVLSFPNRESSGGCGCGGGESSGGSCGPSDSKGGCGCGCS